MCLFNGAESGVGLVSGREREWEACKRFFHRNTYKTVHYTRRGGDKAAAFILNLSEFNNLER